MGYKKVTVELDDGRVLTYRDVIAMTTWTWDDIKYITDLGDTAREFGLTEALTSASTEMVKSTSTIPRRMRSRSATASVLGTLTVLAFSSSTTSPTPRQS